MEGNAFSLTSASMPICPAERVIWNKVKYEEKRKMRAFKVKNKQTTINVMFYKIKHFRYVLYTTAGCYFCNK